MLLDSLSLLRMHLVEVRSRQFRRGPHGIVSSRFEGNNPLYLLLCQRLPRLVALRVKMRLRQVRIIKLSCYAPLASCS